LIRLRRPTSAEIAAVLRSDGPLTYPEEGETARLDDSEARAALARRYDLDRHERVLGHGRATFEAAREALRTWRHFALPWVELHGASPVTKGQVVAPVARFAGVWFLGACRVIHAHLDDEADHAWFAYGTLRGHPESGEERFTVRFDAATDEVRYEIAAFSRPALLVTKLGYPLARRLQRRFAAGSSQALAQAVA
jgi:uncharacterized protein (UPF0548 family)